MQHYTMDFVKRMQGIKATLDNETAETDEAVHEKEQLLDELMEIVEHIDHARGQSLRLSRKSGPLKLRR